MISLLFRALSRVFSSTTVSKASISSLTLSLLYGPTLTCIYDYWKNHSFDYRTFAGQVMSLLFKVLFRFVLAVPGGSEVKASACNAGDLGSIPGSERSPGEGNGNPLQYSCLEYSSWTVPHQAPLSMGFSRQEYWSGLPFPSPGDLPDPGIEPRSPSL